MSNPSTPRSRSRSRRSTTNLRNLRLAPLSTKYVEPPHETPSARSPYGETPDTEFTRQHSSYLQGRSAPNTPGILSRNSSRRRNDGGLSRREVHYDEDEEEDEMDFTSYRGPRRFSFNDGAEFGTRITKAKSEAAIFDTSSRLSGHGLPRHHRPGLAKTHSHRADGHRRAVSTVENNWLMRTGAAASAILQESKGQSWLASGGSSAAVAASMPVVEDEQDDEDDEGYEEMAAISATTAKLHAVSSASAVVDGPNTGRRPSRWGSRYGSRSTSRRASRAQSPKGSRTPRQSDPTGYFDDVAAMLPVEEPGFINPRERPETFEDQEEVGRLTSTQSFGLGALVDSLMNFKLFKVDDQGDTTEDEMVTSKESETDEEARERMAAEARRKREEKASLTKPPPALADGQNGQGEAGGWQDAAWLLSVASKAIW